MPLPYYTWVDDLGIPRMYYPNVVFPGQEQFGGGNKGVSVNATPLGVTDSNTLNDIASGLQELAAQHQLLLANNSLIATGVGGNASQAMPTATVRKPWLDAGDGSLAFDPAASIVLPAAPSGNTVVVSLIVPSGYDGVINAYSWNFTGGGFVDGSGDIVAQILRNGAPIRNYDNILVQKGSIQIARSIAPIRIFSNDLIQLVVNHVANNLLNGNIIGSFVGWFYPSEG